MAVAAWGGGCRTGRGGRGGPGGCFMAAAAAAAAVGTSKLATALGADCGAACWLPRVCKDFGGAKQ